MVDAVVSFAIEKISDFLTQEINMRLGVGDDVEWLKDELQYLLISVRAAQEKQQVLSGIDNEKILVWINSVRDVANGALLILERFSVLYKETLPVTVTDAPRKQGVLDSFRCCICMGENQANLYDKGKEIVKKEVNLYDIGKEIQSLKEKVALIKTRRDEYGIANILDTPVVPQRKRILLRATSFENQVDVVGFKDDVHTLLAQLGKENTSLGMISIHGMGGLGKTTVASKLYHSQELSHFKRRAWVCVSEDYNIEDVLKKMIERFMGHEPDSLKSMQEVGLKRHLRKLLLEGDRYLVVIDDIWSINVWEKIKKTFPDNICGRVIITTRDTDIAKAIDERCFVHKLRFLEKDESRELFRKIAQPRQNLEKLGEEMVDKCGGLPLAIVVLGGLLYQNQSYTFWSDVKEHIWTKLKRESEKSSAEIQEILSLSYDNLSFKMRRCFLYLARYPEDHEIVIEKLKLLWIAEEFITVADEGVMEDVAEDYLNELINRNMMQITSLRTPGDIRTCKVHDLVRDLAIQKATEDKLLGAFDSTKHRPSNIHLLQGQPRHAIHNEIGEYLKLIGPSPDKLKLRSLAVITKNGILKIEEMGMICTRYKYLKVLDMCMIAADRIPEEIGDMVLLKLLGLMGNNNSKCLVIPPTIGKLTKLQTLYGSHGKYKCPRELCELKELRHLYFFRIIGSLNIGRHQTELQTLVGISYDAWIQIDTLNLPNLRTLFVTNFSRDGSEGEEEEEEDKEDKVYSLDYSMANLTSLRSLKINFSDENISTIKSLRSCKHLTTVFVWGRLIGASELEFLPHSVTSLALIRSCLKDDPMPILGCLPNLNLLYLEDMYKGQKMVSRNGAFPCLEYFKLDHFKEEWVVEDGAFPALKYFDSQDRALYVPPRIASLPQFPKLYKGHPLWVLNTL